LIARLEWAFIGQRGGVREGVLGRRSTVVSGKEKERGGCWGWSRATGYRIGSQARQKLLQRSAKVGKPERGFGPLPWSSGQIMVRGGNRERGGGKVGVVHQS
jgi:hypothetical protein